MIKDIRIEIGSSPIDRQGGDWINIWNQLTRNFALDRGFDIMIGNVPSMYNYNHYHPEYTMYIPMQFFFNRHISNA